MADYMPQPRPVAPGAVFRQAKPQSMRFVTSYSLKDGWRGRPQIAVLQVIPGDVVAGDTRRGVRLIVNEIPYTGPAQAGQSIAGIERIPLPDSRLSQFAPVLPGPQSFVLADRLAFCRFLYLQPLPRGAISDLAARLGARRSSFRWASGSRWRRSIPGRPSLHVTTVTVPLHVTRTPGTIYADRSVSKTARDQSGSALLMVLWLTAALAAIGLAVASNVRGETERTQTSVDDARSYFEARGGIERAALHILWGRNYRDRTAADLLRSGHAIDGSRVPRRRRACRHHPGNLEAEPERIAARGTAATCFWLWELAEDRATDNRRGHRRLAHAGESAAAEPLRRLLFGPVSVFSAAARVFSWRTRNCCWSKE